MALFGCLASPPAQTAEGGNLADNGGFEKGESGWMWQQWKGKPLPGYIDREDMHEGLASFKLHQDDDAGGLHIAKAIRFQQGHDHVLSLALKPEGMPDGAARVRVLIDGRGWYGKETGRVDVVKTGGTQGWKTYTVPISAAALGGAAKLTVFIYHDRPNQGTLGIDAVSLAAARAAASPDQNDLKTFTDTPAAPVIRSQQKGAAKTVRTAQESATPSIRGDLKTVSYTAADPVVLSRHSDAAVAVRASPDRALYRVGELPAVTVESSAARGATLAYRLVDGFGTTLSAKSIPADRATKVEVPLPAGHGYYEIIASLERSGERLSEARRSIGVLSPPAPPVGDEPFGLWVQGAEHYPELGVRWVRFGVVWDSFNRRGDTYIQSVLKYFRWCRENNIRVLAFPKGHPRRHQTSREVIADTPEAWRAEEEWWTNMVRRLAGYVDAWAVVNEPIRGRWKGSDALIMRYWTLMRRIVDRYDPGRPLIGPSLSPNSPAMVAQYHDLLGMGFARYIDAVEMHTYIASPEDNDWQGNTQRIRDMTKQAAGKDLPVWSTEHGSTATYQTELLQAQHLMRSWLVAKKIGYPVMIWHMFSNPQNPTKRESEFGIFRSAKRQGEAPPQPRPAGVAYGVMTRQLAGAKYRTELDYLGPSIHAYAFERNGKAMVALWTTSQKTYRVSLSAGDETQVTETGLFGRVEPLAVRDGVVHVTVDRSPKLISPLPTYHLQAKPLARVEKPIEVVPGKSARATLKLTNPTPRPAQLRIEWLPSAGWNVALPQDRWTLAAGQTASVPLTATAPRDLAIGRYQVHAKVYLDGKYVTALSALARVLPQVTLDEVSPAFEQGRPVLAGSLRRLDPTLRTATVQLGDNRSEGIRLAFGSRDQVAFALPVRNPPSDHLQDMTLIVKGAQDKVQLQEGLRLSFAPARHFSSKPRIDGRLDDWPTTDPGDGAHNVRWGWDERNLYLAVRVEDATHVQNQQIDQMWKDDSLQIGLASDRKEQLVRDILPGLFESDMVELDMALRRDGPAMYRHRTVNQDLAPSGEVKQEQVRYAVSHSGGTTTYEAQIPVEQAGLRPLRAKQVLRASLLINGNDSGRRRSTEWFGGIKEAKDPTQFGHLILRN